MKVRVKMLDSGKEASLEFTHAQRCLLKWERLYELVDEKFEIKEGELRVKPSKRVIKKSVKRGSDPES